MIVHGLLLAALTLGHLVLIVLVINVSHGLGYDARRMDRFVMAILVVVFGLTLWAGWWLAVTPWAAWPFAAKAYAGVALAVALIGLPGVTIARALRPRPAEVSGRSAEVDLAANLGASPPVGRGPIATLLKLPGNESLRLWRSQWRVELPDLPRACDGLTIVQLSDFHFQPGFDRRYFEAVADEAMRGVPDLAVFTGDLIDDASCLEWAVPVLSRVRGRLGQFAILGNHDRHFDPGPVAGALEEAGFTLLEGRWTRIEVGDAAIALGGTSFPWGPALDPAEMPEADVRVLLSHTPDLLYRASGWGIDLMLSGHNHGGQVRLPLIGPVLMPSRFSRRFDQGFFRDGPTLLYACRGVAAKHPIRYGCPPEVAVFELRTAPVPARREGASKEPRPEHERRRSSNVLS
jgi:predicted MPP superfamily phosphohydrolase